jgi:hypothetical protein
MRRCERKAIGVTTRYAVGRAEKVVAAQQLAHKGSRHWSATTPSSSFARAVDIRGLQGRTIVRASEGFFVGSFRSAPRINPPAMGDENRLSQ